MASKLSPTQNLVDGNTNFALGLYKEVAKDIPGGNVFMSPFSISVALAMTGLGARENTLDELCSTLGFSEVPDSDLHPTFSDLNAMLKTEGGTSGYKLQTANRLFCRKDFKILEEFLDATRKHYQAEAALMDFGGDAEGSRQAINKWVEEQTANKIQELLPSGVIGDRTSLVLVNAIYFKGDWTKPFKERHTKKAPFHLTKDEKIDVNMMSMKEDLPYGENTELDAKVLELHYGNKDLSMIIILPNQVDGIQKLEATLTKETLDKLTSNLFKEEIRVSLPKFKTEQQFKLNDVLSKMGMKDIFIGGKADLSGIDGSKQLYVSHVIHKAFVDVNEEGTEAAAATAVAIALLCMPAPPKVFKADHPFLFYIRDNRSKSILFLGRMMKPTAA